MKRCPICATTYPDRVDFCFSDGAPLVAIREVVARESAPAVVMDAPPRPLPELQPEPSGIDLDDPTSLVEPASLSIAPVSRRRAAEPEAVQAAPEADPSDLPEELSEPTPLGADAPDPAADLPGAESADEEELSAPAPLPPPVVAAEPAVEPAAQPETAPAAPEASQAAPTSPPTTLESEGTAPQASASDATEVVQPVEPPRRGPVRARPVAPEAPAAPAPKPAPAPRAEQEDERPAATRSFEEPSPAPAPMPADEPAPPSSNKTLMLALVGIAAVMVVVAVGYFATRSAPPAPDPIVKSVNVSPPPAPAPAPPPPPVVPEPAPEVLPEAAPEVVPEPALTPVPVAPSPTPAPPAPVPKPVPAPAPAPAPAPVPAPAPAPEAAATTGTLTVTTRPSGASIAIDGVPAGVSPVKQVLPFGKHTISATLAGYEPSTATVNLLSATITKSIELKATLVKGTIYVSAPEGATIKMDGVVIGTGRATVTVTEGSHSFEVVNPDGTTRSKTQNIRFNAEGRAVSVAL